MSLSPKRRLAALLSGALILIAPLAAPLAVHAEDALQPRTGRGVIDFDDALIANFRTRVAANAEARSLWEANKAEADRLLTVPTSKISLNPRGTNETLEPLILAWRMTDDKRYEQKIYEILSALCDRPSWETDLPLTKRDPVWHSDLGMGMYGQDFGRAYSAIRDVLTPDQRRKLVDGYVRGVVAPVRADWLDPATRIHTLDTMGHNWWAHIVFGMGLGLVAILPDEPRASAWLREVDAAGREWWSYGGSDLETKIATFDADGAYSESINYGELALGSYLQYRRAWIEGVTTPPAPAPLLPKALDFFIHNAYPASGTSLSVNFGDGNPEANGSPALATAWALGEHRPDYLWYIRLYNEDGGKTDLHNVYGLPHFFLSLPLPSEPGGQGAAPRLPLDAWYRGMGWATLRNGWDKDATMLAIRSGFTWNHNHADAGSFILFDRGQPLLIDSGNSSYAAPEYDAYYRQSVAHNVVTFNGGAEPKEDTYLGSQLPGKIPLMMDGAGIKYVLADATGPTSANFSRNFRHVLWIDDVILIVDDLKARAPGQFEWLIHTAGTAKAQDGALHVVNGAAAVDVRPLYPQPLPTAGLSTDYPELMRLEEKQGYQDHDPRTRVAYYAFAPDDRTERVKFVTALIPQRAQARVRIERMPGPDSLGVRIEDGDKTTDVYLNLKADGSIRHRNANNRLGVWDTDAYLLATTYEKDASRPERVFVADGSYMRQGDRVFYASLSKRFLIADYGAKPQLWASGQAGAAMSLYWPGASSALTLNGAAAHGARDGDGRIELTCCGAKP